MPIIESSAPQSPEVPQTSTPPQEPIQSQQEQSPQYNDFARKFAALTRKEKDILEKSKSQESEYQKRLAELTEKSNKYKKYEELETTLSQDKRKALEFLQQQNISLEDLSSMLIEELNPNEDVKINRKLSDYEKKMEQKLANLEKQLLEREQKAKEDEENQAKSQHEKVVQKVLSDITEFVNAGEYPLIQSQQQVQLVYDVIQNHYQEQIDKGTPSQLAQILGFKEASDIVERHLDEELERLYSAKKPKQKPAEASESNKEASITMSNAHGVTDASKVSGTMSREDALKEAMKMIRFT